MHPKNSTTPTVTQHLLTTVTGFCDTPIDNKGTQMLEVVAGIDSEDALETAKVLASGLGQLCNNLHDSLNYGELAYCDQMKAMSFLAETVSALIWSVQKAKPAADGAEAVQ